MPHKRSSTARHGLPAVLGVATLAGALAACGVGPATNEDKIAKASSTYLRALADGDTATACAQLSLRARGDRCPQAIEARAAPLKPAQLREAADASIEIDVHGRTATATLGEPHGARLTLVKVGREWRVDSGYTVPRRTGAVVRPGVGMSGVELDMTPAEVRATLAVPRTARRPGRASRRSTATAIRFTPA